MRLQAVLNAAPTWFHIRTTLFDVGSTFLCNCPGLQHSLSALWREIFQLGLHTFGDLAATGWEFTAMSFDIGSTCLHHRAGLCCGDGPK